MFSSLGLGFRERARGARMMAASGAGQDDPYAQNTYWLVSLPLDAHTSKEAAWSKLNDKTALEQDLSANYKFPLPVRK